MHRHRQIIIYSTSKIGISNIPNFIKKELSIRNTFIKFILTNTNSNKSSRLANSFASRLELYGYDGKLKYKTNNVSSGSDLIEELKKCISKINKMPMGSLEYRKRQTNKT